MEIFNRYNELLKNLKIAKAIAEQDLDYADPRTRPGLENLRITKKREVVKLSKELRDLIQNHTLYLTPNTSNDDEFLSTAASLGCVIGDLDLLYTAIAVQIEQLGPVFSSSHYSVMRDKLQAFFDVYADKYDLSSAISDPVTNFIGREVRNLDTLTQVIKGSIEQGLIKDGLNPSTYARLYIEDILLSNAVRQEFDLAAIGVFPVVLENNTAQTVDSVIVTLDAISKASVLKALKDARAQKFPTISEFFDAKEASLKKKIKQVKEQPIGTENNNATTGENNE